jgi:hypothetical protein
MSRVVVDKTPPFSRLLRESLPRAKPKEWGFLTLNSSLSPVGLFRPKTLT